VVTQGVTQFVGVDQRRLLLLLGVGRSSTSSVGNGKVRCKQRPATNTNKIGLLCDGSSSEEDYTCKYTLYCTGAVRPCCFC
jgi:hypothetical protein